MNSMLLILNVIMVAFIIGSFLIKAVVGECISKKGSILSIIT